MNEDNPSPNRPLVTVVYKGPDLYPDLQIKKTAGYTSGKCLHG